MTHSPRKALVEHDQLITYALAGLLIASILIFAIAVVPEVYPGLTPLLKAGRVTIFMTRVPTEPLTPEDLQVRMTLLAIDFRRAGLLGGGWLSPFEGSLDLELIGLTGTEAYVAQVWLPTGYYDAVALRFKPVTAVHRGVGLALRSPGELAAPAALKVTEERPAELLLELSFDARVVRLLRSFEPSLSVAEFGPALEVPGYLQSPTIASFGPLSLEPRASSTFEFSIEPNAELEDYMILMNVTGEDARVEVELVETAELWTVSSGVVWLTGGNLSAGTYRINVTASEESLGPATVALKLMPAPSLPASGPYAVAFSGAFGQGSRDVSAFLVKFEKKGTYLLYLKARNGGYFLLMDLKPITQVWEDKAVVLEIDEGIRAFMVVPEQPPSGAPLEWGLALVPTSTLEPPAFPQAATYASIALLAMAALNLAWHAYRRRLARGPLAMLIYYSWSLRERKR